MEFPPTPRPFDPRYMDTPGELAGDESFYSTAGNVNQFHQASFSTQKIEKPSLGNLLLKACAKYHLILGNVNQNAKEIEELASELMNAQCMLSYIEDVWPKYTNYDCEEENPEVHWSRNLDSGEQVDWEIAALLQQVELVLSGLDKMEILDAASEAQQLKEQQLQIAKYREKLCVYIHMACVQIMINSFQK
ncbi:hypothetical protein ABW20_dc0104298 [Dactylellina cionopaga]|nr:hypothetical protein ABW20_dc0104298 [Dactylellina cionopaga]